MACSSMPPPPLPAGRPGLRDEPSWLADRYAGRGADRPAMPSLGSGRAMKVTPVYHNPCKDASQQSHPHACFMLCERLDLLVAIKPKILSPLLKNSTADGIKKDGLVVGPLCIEMKNLQSVFQRYNGGNLWACKLAKNQEGHTPLWAKFGLAWVNRVERLLKEVLEEKGDLDYEASCGVVGPLTLEGQGLACVKIFRAPLITAAQAKEGNTKKILLEYGVPQYRSDDPPEEILRLLSMLVSHCGGRDDKRTLENPLALNVGSPLISYSNGTLAFPNGLNPFRLVTHPELSVLVRRSEFVENLMHMQWAEKHKMYEWFSDVDLSKLKRDVSEWAEYTHSRYINKWNAQHAVGIFAAASAYIDTNRKRKRTSGGACSGSSNPDESDRDGVVNMAPSRTLADDLASSEASRDPSDH
uniref:Uncharacterized protein n=1 Tax=Calcidiscus leptoporus TaxID=127549 RepID=A0A7S0IM33_9EUKA